jgi:large subunit ribosomal protein L26e
MMSSHLSKDLKDKYQVRSIPIRKGDQVKIVRGHFKSREGKVQTVYRRRRCIYIEKIVREKSNGQQSQIPIHPSNCIVTALKLDKDRKAILDKKKKKDTKKDKHKQMSKMD